MNSNSNCCPLKNELEGGVAFGGQPGRTPRGRNPFQEADLPSKSQELPVSPPETAQSQGMVMTLQAETGRKRDHDQVASGGPSSRTQRPALFSPKAPSWTGWMAVCPITELWTSRVHVFSLPLGGRPRRGRKQASSAVLRKDSRHPTYSVQSGRGPGPLQCQPEEGPAPRGFRSLLTSASRPAAHSLRTDSLSLPRAGIRGHGSHTMKVTAVTAIAPYGAGEWLLGDKNLSLTPYLDQGVAFNVGGKG